MKHLKIAGLCLVAMLVMGMALAATASAAPGKPVWEGCLKSAPGTKYESSACQKVGTTNEWGWEEIKNTDKVVSVGFTITLTDTGATGGSSKIQCFKGAEDEGSVGPGNKDRVEVARVKEPKKNCTRIEGGCKAGEVEEVEGANLPWQTEVFETEKMKITNLTSIKGGGKEPGWKVKCNTLIASKEDTCTNT